MKRIGTGWFSQEAFTGKSVVFVCNLELSGRIEELIQTYKRNWGREPEMSCLPSGMTQEDFVLVLERIIETGESILVGWGKCFPRKRRTVEK